MNEIFENGLYPDEDKFLQKVLEVLHGLVAVDEARVAAGSAAAAEDAIGDTCSRAGQLRSLCFVARTRRDLGQFGCKRGQAMNPYLALVLQMVGKELEVLLGN